MSNDGDDDTSQSSSGSAKRAKEPWSQKSPEAKQLIQAFENYPHASPNINPYSCTPGGVKTQFHDLGLHRFKDSSFRTFIVNQKNRNKIRVDRESQNQLPKLSKAQARASRKASREKASTSLPSDEESNMSGTLKPCSAMVFICVLYAIYLTIGLFFIIHRTQRPF